MVYISNPQTWIVVATTLIVVTLCVGLHYEILVHCGRYLKQFTDRRRKRVLVLILVILLAHSLQIWLFGIGYGLLLEVFDGGQLAGAVIHSYVDYVYYSAVVFTTVGFGDITPHGPIRFMTGMEALTGLVMITWSASYTFLEMQRDWTSE